MGINDLLSALKKYGYRRTIIAFFLLVVFVHGPGVFYAVYSDKNFVKAPTDPISFTQNNNGVADNNQKTPPKEIFGKTTAFNPEDWFIDKFRTDSEGYYCPNTTEFQHWSMWSKKKFSPETLIKIRLKIKNRVKQESIAPAMISYGEYTPNYAPSIFYRMSFFDGTYKSIRLYDSFNEGIAQDWISIPPDLRGEMTIVLEPKVPDNLGRKLTINPRLTYIATNSARPLEFIPQKEFNTLLPTVELTDGSLKQQFGIGTNTEGCIKIQSIEINEIIQ